MLCVAACCCMFWKSKVAQAQRERDAALAQLTEARRPCAARLRRSLPLALALGAAVNLPGGGGGGLHAVAEGTNAAWIPTEPSRAEPRGSEPIRADPSRAEVSRAEPR